MVTAFKQGIASGPFNDSLIRNPVETFFKVRQWVVAHINEEEVVATKHDNSFSRKPKSKESSRARPLRVNETSVGREWIRGTYHTQPGETCLRQRPEGTFHFDPSSKYHIRNCWASQESWKS